MDLALSSALLHAVHHSVATGIPHRINSPWTIPTIHSPRPNLNPQRPSTRNPFLRPSLSLQRICVSWMEGAENMGASCGKTGPSYDVNDLINEVSIAECNMRAWLISYFSGGGRDSCGRGSHGRGWKGPHPTSVLSS